MREVSIPVGHGTDKLMKSKCILLITLAHTLYKCYSDLIPFKSYVADLLSIDHVE